MSPAAIFQHARDTVMQDPAKLLGMTIGPHTLNASGMQVPKAGSLHTQFLHLFLHLFLHPSISSIPGVYPFAAIYLQNQKITLPSLIYENKTPLLTTQQPPKTPQPSTAPP